jgi:hypothetical protein
MNKQPKGTKRSCVQLHDDDIELMEGLTEEQKQVETKRAYSEWMVQMGMTQPKNYLLNLVQFT